MLCWQLLLFKIFLDGLEVPLGNLLHCDSLVGSEVENWNIWQLPYCSTELDILRAHHVPLRVGGSN
jgi:hypothetical protein